MFRTLTMIGCSILASFADAENSMRVYFGTYTGGDSKGIYLADFDVEQGSLSNLRLVSETENPSFLALHPSIDVLYSVSEVRAGGQRTGAALIAWKIDPNSGKLTELGRVPSGGDGPCHVSVDPSGRFAALASYSGGSVTLATLDANGVPSAPNTIQHQGSSGVDSKRQEAPHAHCVRFTPQGELLLVTDLGLDRVLCYQYLTGMLKPASIPFAATAPGAGPRHMKLSPDGRWLLVINELANTVTSYRFDAASGKLTSAGTASTLPEGFQGSNSTAEVCVHPNGRWVYGSNRAAALLYAFLPQQEQRY